MPDLRLGTCSSDLLHFTFERLEDALRLFLVNADESGSMGGRTHENVRAYEAVAASLGGKADIVILHGFASDSDYEVILSAAAQARLPGIGAIIPTGRGKVLSAEGPEAVIRLGRDTLARHAARGSTNPASHPQLLRALAALLDKLDGELELVVLNSSDGGFDGGPQSALTQQIEAAMRLVTARSRCLLAANVLVGSAGSPDALGFFTGDSEKYDNRLLFSTLASAPGVLLLSDFDPSTVQVGANDSVQHTISPALPIWRVTEGDALVTWAPEGAAASPRTAVVRRILPKPGGRRMVMRAEVSLNPRDVTLDRDGVEVFDLIARSLSDNPYLREASRAALNGLIAPLEALLGTRDAVLAMLVASPADLSREGALVEQIAANTRAIRAVVDAPELSPHARASRCNALNNARRLLKAELRQAREAMQQAALERELGFYEAHPNHWLLWLQPAIDRLKEQLGATQVDPGDKMAHLSTRIRTAKSAADGRARAADRFVDKLLAESRARRDRLSRVADPRDAVPFEAPGAWLTAACPVSGLSLTRGLAAIPFVADRSDLTSGNIMSGGQNVDRMPIDDGPLLSLSAVRELMWGELGQMASPYTNGAAWYNAAIPVLLGPATPDTMRELERALGWLSTGTSAFVPVMAEAIPGALAVLLGDPADGPNRSPTVQALLRTAALLPRYRSYPYVPGTAVFDEAAPMVSLTQVWAQSLDAAGGAACLQSLGCITSLFGRAVAADQADAAVVADDLFAWACRNIARGVLGTGGVDGRGGVEGIRRLAAALFVRVELAGHPLGGGPAVELAVAPTDRAPEGLGLRADDDGEWLVGPTLSWVLGPAAAGWTLGPVLRAGFTDALNAHLSALSGSAQTEVILALDGIFHRLDSLTASTLNRPTESPELREAQAAKAPAGSTLSGQTHPGFDDAAALEALRPRRLSTPVPPLTSPLAQARRMTKAGETAWLPPADAGLSLNPSALSFFEGHTALYPLRAWLRLVEAGLVGQPALQALRASEAAPLIPALPAVLPRLASLLGGMDAVLLQLRRAFAFVLTHAHGYADSQWATSPLRTATAEAVDAVLGAPTPPVASPRAYGAADHLDLSVGDDWPKMDARGYLPKAQAIGRTGAPLLPPPRLGPEALGLSDPLLVQAGCAAMLSDLVASGLSNVFGGLHRGARRLLGEQALDLRALPEAERHRLILEELAPKLAGWVRGDPAHPQFFPDCVNILHQLCALGVDTRSFRADEPAELIAAEAKALRAGLTALTVPAAGGSE